MRQPKQTTPRRWPRRLGLAVGSLVLLLIVGIAGALVWMRTSLPQIEGVVALPGLQSAVSISRDDKGIPRIKAESEGDALFALGYVHAQDRLWQMEQMRRVGAGRLSEVLGSATLDYDRFMRTLGVHRLAQHSYETASPELKAALERYADGVNVFLTQRRGALPPEFNLLWVEPEPWTPADTLVWGRLMGLQLSGNWYAELARARLARHFTAEQIEELWTAEPAARHVPLSQTLQALDETRLAAIQSAAPEAIRPRLASNIWALDGSQTESGRPLLANDPHLGLSNPGLWYLVRIDTPTRILVGATTPGVPLMLIGHNGKVAWGFTTTHSDTADIFIERLDPADPTRYLTPEGSATFESRKEIIRVRGGEPVTLTVRSTRHGPVISDGHGDSREVLATLPEADAQVLALSATILRPEDQTAEAFFRMNRADTAADFREALRNFQAPQQNVGFADTGGDIGIVSAGLVPIRRQGDGFLPVPGWTSAHDWAGFVPFEELPQRFNPATGRIVNANNSVVDPGYPHFLGREFDTAYRARRIADRLDRVETATLPDMASIQMDSVSSGARELLPVILPMIGDRETRDLLSEWDGTMDRARPEPLLYSAWLRHIQQRLLGDEFARAGNASLHRPRLPVMARMLAEDSAWCDDVSTTGRRENCTDIVRAALADALAELRAAHGSDSAGWRWGDAHEARFSNMVLGSIPLINRLTDVAVPTDGGDDTVNRGTSRFGGSEPYRHVHGAGLRAVFDLSDLDRSIFVQAPGQSGNPFSAHYDDLAQRWSEVAGFPIPPQAEGPAKTLHLEPAR
ncbi:MAG: penicillin acylase family protein [Alphaproteobacteria bacterium]|nr:penicillin acylase family protein [Alphaproteobacteria bacterium]MBU0795984.1 penicillin acylase family protein [Alphaproteobacteria bacterium]MBU0885672.1 penicillin acylase family protein [Alphaproteobacteria bacterium]MBU1812672.1 penicillin acylase family protein [Alphaproteobacteria bacterium]